jgi:glucosamine-6-phosphate deaminase
MSEINIKDLYKWCSIPSKELQNHPDLKIPFRIVNDSEEMGNLISQELIDEIKVANLKNRPFAAIIPCGPRCWYEPFTKAVNSKRVSLKNFFVFHMDDCLDWEGKLLAKNDPYNFRTFMEKYFYEGILPEFSVPESQRFFLEPSKVDFIKEKIKEFDIDMTIGGWGQDGHVAYNQTRRSPYSRITLDQLKNSDIRIQDNNIDTIIALSQRSFGAAYQFVPPMSVTLGMKQCLSAKKIRIFSDTGDWKKTALRVALFSAQTVEYPVTLLQDHPDAVITATLDTANHPISEHPEWEFKGINI